MFTNLIGGKPTIPQWNPVTLQQSQQQAVNENIAQLPKLEKLTSQIDQFGADEIQKLLEQAIPGYTKIVGQESKNITSLLEGQIPTDVTNAIQDSDVAQSLTGGFGGTGLAGNRVARDLGLTSLQLTSQGLSSAESWIAQMNAITSPSRFNMASMFVTPQQQFEDTFRNNEAQFQRDYASNMNDFDYSFRQAAAKDFNATANTVLSIAESYLGGMGGGGGGGMGGMMGGGGSSGGSSFNSGNGMTGGTH